MRRHPILRDYFGVYCIVGIFCGLLCLLASCQFPAKRSGLPYPPGFTPSLKGIPQANTPLRAIQRANMALPAPNTTLTCDFGDGPMDGVNIWESLPNGILTLLQTYPPTNVFALWLDPSRPHRLAVTSFRNWPAPYLVSSYIDDSGNMVNTTNFYVESDPAWFVYVPNNCPSIGLFTTTTGLVLCGWNSGTNLEVDSSPDNVHWSEQTHVTSTGAWTYPVDSPQGALFWRSRQ